MSIVIPAENTKEAILAVNERLSADAVLIAKALDMLGAFAVNLTIAIIILCATLIAARWASGATKRVLGRTRSLRHDQTVVGFIAQIVRVVVIVVGMIAVLQRLGVQTTSIIAVLGAASLAVGLALQGALSNVAAGVILLILRPYRIGNTIEVSGVIGTVVKLDLFTTHMNNANNNKIIIPNSKVLGDVITNLTGQTNRRISINFTVGYDDDLNKARAVIAAVAKAHPQVLAEPAVWTGVTGLLDSSVQITLNAWVRTEDHFQTSADLMQAGKEALDANDIEIPYPHQVTVEYAPKGIASAEHSAQPVKE